MAYGWAASKKPFSYLLWLSFFLININNTYAVPTAILRNSSNTPVPAAFGSVGGITSYTEIHLLSNWPTSSGTPNASNTNCGNGVYATNTMTQIGAGQNNTATYLYSCTVSFTTYEKQHNTRWLSEQSSSSNYGWNSVSPNNAPNGNVTDMATFKYPNGYPNTTYAVSSTLNMGPGGAFVVCNSVALSATITGTSTTYSVAATTKTNSQTYPSQATIWWADNNLSMQVYPNEQLTFTKTVGGNSHNNMQCIVNYTVPLSDIGASIYIDCCPSTYKSSYGSGMVACPSSSTCSWNPTSIVTASNSTPAFRYLCPSWVTADYYNC